MALSTPSLALAARSTGMNQRYGLGRFAPMPVDAPGPAAPVDPYAAILAGLPKPLTGSQVSHEANAEISPLLAAVTKQIGGQTAAATHAIGGFTADAASKLAGIDFAAPYASGEQGQAAVDAALRDSLAGAGQHGADELAQRLGVINDPTVGAAAHAPAANGAANGATQVAQGSASLGNLIANAASAGEFGLKQPGITRLAGLQNIAAAGQQGQAAIAAKAAELEAQLPSIIQNLQARNDARDQSLTAARENQVARQDALASGAAATETKYKLADATNMTKLQIADMNAQGKASAAQATQARSDRSFRLSFSRTFKFDPVTGSTLPGYTRDASGAVVKVGTTKSAGANPEYPNLTKSQVVHLRAGISAAFNGVPEQRDVNNKLVAKPLPPTDYQTAISHAISAGYSRAAATKMANHFYAPGERGRPAKPKPDTGFRSADVTP
jgi:hypothetical protein